MANIMTVPLMMVVVSGSKDASSVVFVTEGIAGEVTPGETGAKDVSALVVDGGCVDSVKTDFGSAVVVVGASVAEGGTVTVLVLNFVVVDVVKSCTELFTSVIVLLNVVIVTVVVLVEVKSRLDDELDMERFVSKLRGTRYMLS